MADKIVTPELSHSLLLQALEQISNIDQKIGVVQGQVHLVLEEHSHARDKRDKMYEKLNKIDTIEADLKRIIPLVDKHEEKHNQAVGGWRVGSGLWKMIVSGGLGAGAVEAVQHLIGTRPHP